MTFRGLCRTCLHYARDCRTIFHYVLRVWITPGIVRRLSAMSYVFALHMGLSDDFPLTVSYVFALPLRLSEDSADYVLVFALRLGLLNDFLLTTHYLFALRIGLSDDFPLCLTCLRCVWNCQMTFRYNVPMSYVFALRMGLSDDFPLTMTYVFA